MKPIVLTETFQKIQGGVYEVVNSSRAKRYVLIKYDGKTCQKTLPAFSAGDVLIVGTEIEIRQRPGRYEVSLTPKADAERTAAGLRLP